MPASYDPPTINTNSRYGLHIDSKNEMDLTCVTVPLTTNTSIACSIHNDTNPVFSLPIAIIPSTHASLENGVALDTDYPKMEPHTTSVCTSFGKRFGVPFLDRHGSWLCRKITSLELIACYSINVKYLISSIGQHQLDSMTDSLLPGCLP